MYGFVTRAHASKKALVCGGVYLKCTIFGRFAGVFKEIRLTKMMRRINVSVRFINMKFYGLYRGYA